MKTPSSKGNLFNSSRLSKKTDSEIIQLYLKTQRSEYFSILYKRYSGKVFSKCISLLKDEGRARDATQEIFHKNLSQPIEV